MEKISEPSVEKNSVSLPAASAEHPSGSVEPVSTPAAAEASEKEEKVEALDSDLENPYFADPELKECFVAGSKECIIIGPEQDKKYSLEAVLHPEMAALWVGDFYDAKQSLKINADGTYRQLSTIDEQPIDFNARYAVRGKWRVAGDELVLRTIEGNCEFCARTLKIVENGSALAVPGMGPEFVFRKQ